MPTSFRCFAFLLTVAVGSFASHKEAAEATRQKSEALVGKSAPELSLPDMEGKTVHLSDSRGHVTLLAFWATWCPPCRSELPYLAKLQKEWSASGIDVVLVAVHEDPATVNAFLSKKGIQVRTLIDGDGSASKPFGASFIPKAFVLRRDGTVAQFL